MNATDTRSAGPIATSAEAMEDAALIRAVELRADGPSPAVPVPAAIARGVRERSAAEWAYQRIVLYLRAFEDLLAADQVVAMAFAGGPAGVLRIRGVGFHAPDLVTFTGIDSDGNPAQAIQHVSQLNLLLRAIPRPSEQPEPERIGFRLARAMEGAAEGMDDDAEPPAAAS